MKRTVTTLVTMPELDGQTDKLRAVLEDIPEGATFELVTETVWSGYGMNETPTKVVTGITFTWELGK